MDDKKKKFFYEDDMPVASASECTGLVPTAPGDDDIESYNDIYNIPDIKDEK